MAGGGSDGERGPRKQAGGRQPVSQRSLSAFSRVASPDVDLSSRAPPLTVVVVSSYLLVLWRTSQFAHCISHISTSSAVLGPTNEAIPRLHCSGPQNVDLIRAGAEARVVVVVVVVVGVGVGVDVDVSTVDCRDCLPRHPWRGARFSSVLVAKLLIVASAASPSPRPSARTKTRLAQSKRTRANGGAGREHYRP